MKKFLFGIVVGVVLVVGGFFVLNNYIYQSKQADDTAPDGTSVVTEDKHPLLNVSQEQALQNFGIDPKNLPTSLTPSQEECFIEKLGQSRINEIMAGGTPTAFEILNTAGCLGK